MERYHKFLSFFSYVFGFIALIAMLTDNKRDKLYSFHIWQAFILNIFLAIIGVIFFAIYMPRKILTIEVSLRTNFFLKSLLIPLFLTIFLLVILGIVAFNNKYFKIPLLGDLANKISGYGIN